MLTFSPDTPTIVKFAVDIAGTSQAPTSVSVIAQKAGKSVAFAASDTGAGWQATIEKLNEVFGFGPIDCRVEVILAGRVFVPLKLEGQIVDIPKVEAVLLPALDEAVPAKPAAPAKAASAKTAAKHPSRDNKSETPAKQDDSPETKEPEPTRTDVAPDKHISNQRTLSIIQDVENDEELSPTRQSPSKPKSAQTSTSAQKPHVKESAQVFAVVRKSVKENKIVHSVLNSL